ncbi:MAG: ATP-binding protein [Novosphingobium sp.]|jgi:signal transduction histidine kinase
MRLWPRSLQGQLLLAVALALLLGQTINGALLYRAQAERREAQLLHTVAFRLYGALRDDDDAELPRRFRRPPAEGMMPGLPGSHEGAAPRILPGDERLIEQEEDLREALASQGITLKSVQVLRRNVGVDPVAQRRLERRLRRGEVGRLPESVIVAAVRREADGPWAVARVLVPPPPARPLLGLMVQTLVIYALLVGAIALILQRLTKPLKALTRRVEHFAATRDASDPMAPAGPADVRRLIAAHTALEGRIAALLDEKDVMLGAIGHDLKTPLAALRVRIESVEDEAERAKMAATIEDIARSLDDILSLARVGRPGDPLELTDLTALTVQVVEEFEDMGEAVSFAGAERVTLPLRPTWLRRALRNLISNALRHGSGTAQVSLARGLASVTITVEDDGPGIAEGEIERMLEPFIRGEPSRNRGTGGAGLGLTLARAIAEQHGGSLKLANRSGGTGLSASLTLPLG